MVMEIGANAQPKQPENKPRRAGSPIAAAKPPARAEVNFIPSAESLATLIHSAIAALKQGVFWDRGTILNVLA